MALYLAQTLEIDHTVTGIALLPVIATVCLGGHPECTTRGRLKMYQEPVGS